MAFIHAHTICVPFENPEFGQKTLQPCTLGLTHRQSEIARHLAAPESRLGNPSLGRQGKQQYKTGASV